MAPTEACYTLIGLEESYEVPSINDLKQALEKGSETAKAETMKKILSFMMNGEPMHQLLMHVIRFVMPCQKNKFLKKLMLLFFECCPKTNPDGKLKQEWILVCNALRNDLQHPNEYVRGNTLRFVCKLKEAELLEPLLPSIRQCLEYRHSYVRRNAVFSVYTVYKHHDYLIPDAPELLMEFLSKEGDMACKRNAFNMLYNIDQKRAVKYLGSVLDQVPSFDEHLQLAIVELIHKECQTESAEKAKFIKCIFALVSAASNAVKYDSANTLISLTSAPTAVKAVGACYIDLAVKESDNNVKLIVLNRFKALKDNNGKLLDDFAIDILRVLSCPDLDVRKRAIAVMLEMISSKNSTDVVNFLKKELLKTRDQDYDKGNEYRLLLVQSINACAIKFSSLSISVSQMLLEFVNDKNVAVGAEVVQFIREVFEKYPESRKTLLNQVQMALAESRHSKVARGLVWILGEYCSDMEDIESSFTSIKKCVGDIPIVETELQAKTENLGSPVKEDSKSPSSSLPAARRILPDGTYASESVFSSNNGDSSVASRHGAGAVTSPGGKSRPSIRGLLLDGEFFLGSCLASSLLKLVLRAKNSGCGFSIDQLNRLSAEGMLIITSIVRLGRSDLSQNKMDEDSFERMMLCLKLIAAGNNHFKGILLEDQKKALSAVLKKEDEKRSESIKANGSEALSKCQVDDLLQFRQLQSKISHLNSSPADSFDIDVMKATGSDDEKDAKSSKLDSVVQLTGFSDPIYAEAYVDIHKYDIVLDVLLVNQTTETFQNVLLELSTMGDLKLVEKPAPITLGPHSFHSTKVTIKVSSSDNGIIFGNLLYDRTGALDTHCVVFNNINIDIIEYMKPAVCSDVRYRSMWVEFEWENKVNVKTNIKDLHEYLNMILEGTNMRYLSQDHHSMPESCDFLAANLYCRSIFGEDVVANVCLDKTSDQISGHIRIRTKTQGIAFAIGEKIMSLQRGR